MASKQPEKDVIIKSVPKTSNEKRLIVVLEKASLESVKVFIVICFRECHWFSRVIFSSSSCIVHGLF